MDNQVLKLLYAKRIKPRLVHRVGPTTAPFLRFYKTGRAKCFCIRNRERIVRVNITSPVLLLTEVRMHKRSTRKEGKIPSGTSLYKPAHPQ